MDNVSRDKLVTDARVVLNDIEELLKQAGASTGQQANDLRERAATALRNAQRKLQEAQATVTESGKAAARATDDWVHHHPWSAMGAAAGVGLLIGLLVARR